MSSEVSPHISCLAVISQDIMSGGYVSGHNVWRLYLRTLCLAVMFQDIMSWRLCLRTSCPGGYVSEVICPQSLCPWTFKCPIGFYILVISIGRSREGGWSDAAVPSFPEDC